METTTNLIIRGMAKFLEGGFDVTNLLKTTGQATVEEAIQNGAISFSEISQTVADFADDQATNMLVAVSDAFPSYFPDKEEVDALFKVANTMPLMVVAGKLAESF